MLNTVAPPPKHIHASHDLISLLHLDSLYNTYVRPFADAIGPEDDAMKDEGGDGDGMQVDGEGPGGAGKKRKRGKRAKLEKGYTHLIDDCIGRFHLASLQRSHFSATEDGVCVQVAHRQTRRLWGSIKTILPFYLSFRIN
jgi:hypothetical protein